MHLVTIYLLGPAIVIFVIAIVVLVWIFLNKKSTSLPGISHATLTLKKELNVLQQKAHYFDLKFVELGLALPSGKKVLDSVSGSIIHGRTTAVMGPSGCGKTTFMSTLAGRATYGNTIGSIELNGTPDSLLKYPKLVGFVPQEDVMHRDCTVLENLTFSALTRLPKSMSHAEKEAVIAEILSLLGLEEIKDSLIGDEDVRGISGGQRKRVNIGIELVADPTVLFLDEPTSGLDSSSSKEICNALLQIARRTGMTVVAVIHSPRYEIFQMFDDVLMLGKGGRTVYMGPSVDALAYFESLGFRCAEKVNPADFMMDVIAGDVPREGHPDFHPSQLPELWSTRHPSSPTQPNDQLPISTASSLADLPESTPLLVIPKEQETGVSQQASILNSSCPRTLPVGVWYHFLFGFILCAIVPVLLPVCLYLPPRSQRWLQGGLLGCTTTAASVFTTQYLHVISISTSPVVLSVIFVPYAFWMTCLWVVTIWKIIQGSDLRVVAHFASGSILNIFFVPVIWLKETYINAEMRLAASIGVGTGIMSLVFTYFGLSQYGFGFTYAGICVLLVGMTIVFVSAFRYRRIPTFDRETSSTWYHMVLVFKRSLRQQVRQPIGVMFDIVLPIFSATFLGLIFYNRYYVAPLIDRFPNVTCSNTTFPTNSSIGFLPADICAFLELPPGDPISPQATLTTMSVALAATASSMRIFGAEQTIFKRESRAKLSSEAYYLGKTLAHLVTCLLSSLCFTVFYYALLLPFQVPLWKYFFFYFGIYFTCAGMAYAISLVTPMHLSQLAGVLCILVFMMFSGANPTLDQLKNNELIPYALYLPSYASLFRWSNELYYLMEVAPYHPSVSALRLYSYSFGHMHKCIMMLVLIAVTSRLLGYVAVVRKED